MAGAIYTVKAPDDVALGPPPGVTPCFDDPYTLRPYHNVAASLGLLFSGFFLILRIYTKVCVVKQIKLEDYACTLAFLCYCGWSAMQFEVMNAGGGKHQWNVTEADMAQQYRFTNYSDILYSPAVCFLKISIILLVLRIFCPKVRDTFYWLLQLLQLFNTSFYIVFFFIPIFACNPRQKIWHKKEAGKCMNVFALYVSSGAFNTLSDLLMFFVPLWRIWQLPISNARKLGISAIFSSGAFAVISAISRLYYCTALVRKASYLDYSYIKSQSGIWTHAEVAFGIICSCLFVIPRLYRHLAAIPPYGDNEYNDYQRRKSSKTTEEYQGAASYQRRKDSQMSLGGIQTDIEHPPMPPWHDDADPKRNELRPQYSPDRVWKGHFMKDFKPLPNAPRSPKQKSRKPSGEKLAEDPHNITAEEVLRNDQIYDGSQPKRSKSSTSTSHHPTLSNTAGLDRTVGWNSSFAPQSPGIAPGLPGREPSQRPQQRRFPCPLRSPTTEMSPLESVTRFGGSDWKDMRPVAKKKMYDLDTTGQNLEKERSKSRSKSRDKKKGRRPPRPSVSPPRDARKRAEVPERPPARLDVRDDDDEKT